MNALNAPPLPKAALGWLAALGLESRSALLERGVVTTFLQLKAAGHTVTERLLFALEAAARGVHWSQLNDADRHALKRALAAHPPVRLPPPLSEQQHFMALARELAAEGAVLGEVPVGALVVRDGEVLASGFNSPIALSDPAGHAELLALRAAAKRIKNYRLDGCDVYITLEPCAMCAGALLQARVARVIYGAAEPRSGAAGSVLNLFGDKRLNSHTAVFGGVEADACARQLTEFFRQRRQESP